MLILDALKQQTDFTTTEKRLADYILANLPTLANLYIKDLAAATYTSHSAIIRLAQKLGYRGFRDFQHALTVAATAQAQALTAVDANFPFKADDTAASIAKKLAALNVSTIQTTYAQVDEIQLTAAAKLLAHAERIFLFAQGDSQLRARSFQNKLVKINKFAMIAEEYGDEAWQAANLSANDCAVFISYAGTTTTHQQFATYFQQQHIPSILITGNAQSPLIRTTTQQLLAVLPETTFAKVGTFASQAAFEYLLDTLFSLLYVQDYRHNLLKLQRNQGLMQNGPLQTK
ncbi:MurR/RpiR family transcriptional regulator [Lactiplantibacillus nangangensis]|uniref:MurR/RpiR family transcriptional regulator n=1 Tax=Lactiplantibacillus nangangensis TaxID=2559917 RepID=A0ABW1SK67_9LACO|nr:MurR/RpiR family transcriptional regulator [Lactiplantibacillus nangangensis]